MGKRSIFFVLLILVINGSLFSQTNEPKVVNMSMYSKIINALEHWDIKSAVTELKVLSTTENPADEPYFYFFKASITFYSWIQADSVQGNPVLSNIDSAVKYFERALVGNPRIFIPQLFIKSSQDGLDSCSEIMANKAKSYFMNEEYLKAMNYYDKILGFNPKPIYLVGAGLTALKITSFYKAEKCFEQAISIQPTYEKAWIGLCETYKRLNNKNKAIETATKAIIFDSLNKTYLINYYKIASFFKDEIETKIAVEKLEHYLNNDESINQLLANHYISTGNFDKAEKFVLQIASTQSEANRSSSQLKFYYQWFTRLNRDANMLNNKANSKAFMKNWIENRQFIHQKVEKYLNIKTEDSLLKIIVQYFNAEFVGVLN